jgi:protein-L-isoaspartate O-methyltransferase
MGSERATKLRDAADAMQPRIDAKMDPAIGHQNLTARRARIARGMREEGRALEAVQRCLRHLAELHERGTVPDALERVTSAGALERVISWGRRGALPDPDGWCKDDRAKLARIGIDTEARLRAAWAALVDVYEDRRPPSAEERVRDLEASLIGVDIPGFFPTPAPLADRLCKLAGVADHHRVLEPSAGKGDLVAAILRAAPGAKVAAVERNHTLAELVGVRFGERVELHRGDFLEARDIGEPFDRVVMNPPFERYADRGHVLHALDMLRPGGLLISIMGAGSMFATRGVDEFRAALGERCRDWDVMPLPEGSFTGAQAFRQTGVNTLLFFAEK